MGYIYRFIDKENTIIYIGKTTGEMKTRMAGHKHLPEECYSMVSKIECSELRSIADLGIYEVYFINKYKPVYNTASKYEGRLTCELPELDWVTWNPDEEKIKSSSEKNIKETKDARCHRLIDSLGGEIKALEAARGILDEFLAVCGSEQQPIIWDKIESLSGSSTDAVLDIKSGNGDAMYFLYEGLRLYNSDVFNSPFGPYISIAENFIVERNEHKDVYVIQIGEKWLPYLHYIISNIDYEIRVRANKLSLYQIQLGPAGK